MAAAQEIEGSCQRTGRKLEQGENVHEKQHMAFGDKERQQRKRTGKEKEENAPKVHAAGILKAVEQAALAGEDILKIQQERDYLLIHIAPGDRVLAKWIEVCTGVKK